MFDRRPKGVPNKRAAELAMMAFLTVPCPDRAKFASRRVSSKALFHMLAGRPVATLATDVDEPGRAKFPTITAGGSKADAMAADTIGIRIGLVRHECPEGMGMPGAGPDLGGAGMTGDAGITSDKRGGISDPGNHVGLQSQGIIDGKAGAPDLRAITFRERADRLIFADFVVNQNHFSFLRFHRGSFLQGDLHDPERTRLIGRKEDQASVFADELLGGLAYFSAENGIELIEIGRQFPELRLIGKGEQHDEVGFLF